jgi:heterodisulfide reductase subunit C
MIRQILFAASLLVTLILFSFSVVRIWRHFLLTKPAFPFRNIPGRLVLMLKVAFAQTRIFRRPLSGPLHALVFWGFCVILFGSVEMIIDGLTGSERSLASLGGVYDAMIAGGDIFAYIIAIAIMVFLGRRLFIHVRRFEGIEMKRISHLDADIALSMILFLMISLIGMNITYLSESIAKNTAVYGTYPVSNLLAGFTSGITLSALEAGYQFFWWSHILTIFAFSVYLPYSKHFHVFMSVPNVFLARLEPLGKLPLMENVALEVKLMLNPETAFAPPSAAAQPERFGIRDAEDISWKNFLDSLACTECGRCTSVCPANITGKKLSPRKIMMDTRARMKVKGPHLVKEGNAYNDQKSLVRDWISEEELWACTTCNACSRECPICINQPELIVQMRRYLVMEEGSAPGLLKTMFNTIENNGAPWQYSAEDRLLWAKELEIKLN